MPLMVFIVFSGNLVQPLVKNNCGGLIIDGLVIVGVMLIVQQIVQKRGED